MAKKHFSGETDGSKRVEVKVVVMSLHREHKYRCYEMKETTQKPERCIFEPEE